MVAKKVVVDTNVIISGIFATKDTPTRKILVAGILGRLQFVFSEELKNELNTVLKRPYYREKAKKIKSIIGTLINKSLIIKPKKVSTVYFSDENDHFLLEIALTSRSQYIITGDKFILSYKKVTGVEIISPSFFSFLLL